MLLSDVYTLLVLTKPVACRKMWSWWKWPIMMVTLKKFEIDINVKTITKLYI